MTTAEQPRESRVKPQDLAMAEQVRSNGRISHYPTQIPDIPNYKGRFQRIDVGAQATNPAFQSSHRRKAVDSRAFYEAYALNEVEIGHELASSGSAALAPELDQDPSPCSQQALLVDDAF